MKKFIKMFKNLDFEAIIYIMCVLGVFISFFLYSLFFILIINKKFKKKATCSEVITEQFCSTLGSLAKVQLKRWKCALALHFCQTACCRKCG